MLIELEMRRGIVVAGSHKKCQQRRKKYARLHENAPNRKEEVVLSRHSDYLQKQSPRQERIIEEKPRLSKVHGVGPRAIEF